MKKFYLFYSILTSVISLYLAFGLTSDLINKTVVSVTVNGDLFTIIKDFSVDIFGDNPFGYFAIYLLLFQFIYAIIFGVIFGVFKLVKRLIDF